MPIDGDAKTTSDFQNPLQGWLAKCGIVTPSLSVRGRRASDGELNRSIMFLADQNNKKRKRTSRTRIPINMAAQQSTEEKKEPPSPEDDRFAEIKETAGKDFQTILFQVQADKDSWAARDVLIDTEKSLAWDYPATMSSSDMEKKAALLVRLLREYERRVVFGNNPSEAIPSPETRDMGGQFLTNKERIETRSEIFQISKKVPKGALLHLHFNAELYPEVLLREARETDNMYVYSMLPLTSKKALEETEMMFKVLPSTTTSSNIFSDQYKGGGSAWKDNKMDNSVWMRWEVFKTDFEKKFPRMPQREAADATTCTESAQIALRPAEYWILQKMVLSEAEIYRPTQTVNGVWARFNQATRCFKGLVNYRKVYEWYIDQAIERLIKEKVMYAELRPMLLDKSIPTNDGRTQLSNATQMKIIAERVDKKKAELKAEGREDDFPFGLKIIYCTPRSIPRKLMWNEMQECLSLKEQYPDLICGFDLVGAEDRRNHIGFYHDELVAFQAYCKAKKRPIPFLFHAGETLLDTGGSTDPTKSNLYDAVALDSKRVGHGFSLLKHPHLMEKFKKTESSPGICIELCPISNELLHLCRNIKEHPYPELLAAGIPCTINSDNPSLFSNSMSHEFYQIMVGSPTISIHSWKQLALWSVEYSCLSDDEKKRGVNIFMAAWDNFCHKVVKDFQYLLREADVDEHGDEITKEMQKENEKLVLAGKAQKIVIAGQAQILDDILAKDLYTKTKPTS